MEGIEALREAHGVVEHIAEVALDLEIGMVLLPAAEQRLQHPDHRVDRPLERGDLSQQGIDALRHIRIPAEQLVLDLVDVVFEPGDDGHILVDDLVHDRVEHSFRSAREERRIGFHPLSNDCQLGVLGVTDGDDETLTHEHVQLAELHRLRVVVVGRWPQYDEKRVTVTLELGPLMAGERVVDGELMKREFISDRAHLTGIGAIQADPGHAAALLHHLERLVEAFRILCAVSVDVDGVVDDRHGQLTCTSGRRWRSLSACRSTSRVTGATSPTPVTKNRNMFDTGLPSVHSK